MKLFFVILYQKIIVLNRNTQYIPQRRMARLVILILFLFESLIFPLCSYAQSVEVRVSGIRNSSGTINIGVFKDNESFKAEKSEINKIFRKTDIKKGQLAFKLELEKGTYGIALLDDENSNGKMDYGLLFPAEGYGFSNYIHNQPRMPKFESFDFTVDDTPKIVYIKVCYF